MSTSSATTRCPNAAALILDVYLRTDTAARDVWLQRLMLPGMGGGESRVFVYRVIAQGIRQIPAPTTAPLAIADARRPATDRPREALPSTF